MEKWRNKKNIFSKFHFLLLSMKDAWLPLAIAMIHFSFSRWNQVKLVRNQGQIDNKFNSIIFLFSSYFFSIYWNHQATKYPFSFRRMLINWELLIFRVNSCDIRMEAKKSREKLVRLSNEIENMRIIHTHTM